MTDTPRAPTLRDWIPALTLALAIVGLIFAAGDTRAELRTATAANDRQIKEVAARLDKRDDQLIELVRQSASMDAKLDLILRRTSDRP